MGNGDAWPSESDHARPKKAAPRFLARSPCCRSRSLCRLPAPRDELGDFLSTLLAYLFEVLVSVFLGDGVAADLSDAPVEARPVKPLDLLPALLSDLLIEVGAMALPAGLAALLADLLVELRAMPLRGRGASAATRFGDRHRSLVPRHRNTFLAHRSWSCAGRARWQVASARRVPALASAVSTRAARRTVGGHSLADPHRKRAEVGTADRDVRRIGEVEGPSRDVGPAIDHRYGQGASTVLEHNEGAATQRAVRDTDDLRRVDLAAGGAVAVEARPVPRGGHDSHRRPIR